ncbi:phosphonatase-like hydrolase [Leucobacter luti]|uniref:Phosphonatase-like hydrolase n=1 Tax=Leucobacter luti TaxID=340320 RepID=A0A4V6MC07_9MICO|nr:phosphonatase-like hydrolase [Leucobacter luti]MBL3699770.1 phosphonatase-like hydrolase [Leucobacter luti]RZT62909.1 phosphonatase-like hydrolase [Leucobacter luti]
MITLAVFDMAGTTIDDGGAVYRALEDAVTETGVAVAPADLQEWMGTEKRAAITALIGLGGGDATVPGLVEATFDRFREILAERYAAAPPTPIPGVTEAITELRANGVRVALTTGFSRDVASGILTELGWHVDDSSVAGAAPTLAIDALVCGDEVAAGRPAPHMIHRAMERTGTIDVAEVLVAGDTAVDVLAGAHSGAAHSIGVLTGKLDRAEFPAAATAVLASVAQVPAYLAAGELA